MRYYKKVTHAILILTTTLNSIHAQKERFAVDHRHSVLGFSINIMGGLSSVDGTFKDFTAEMHWDKNDFTNSKFNLSARVNSINTGVSGRDEHLISEDFFHADQYPELHFESAVIKESGENTYSMTGDLLIKDSKKEVNITFKRTHKEGFVWLFGRPSVIFEGSTQINREDFGIQAPSRWRNPIAATGELAMGKMVNIHLKMIFEMPPPSHFLLGLIRAKGLEAGLESFEKLAEHPIYQSAFGPQLLLDVADLMKRSQMLAQVEEVLKFNLASFPNSLLILDQLGSYYLMQGSPKIALDYFKAALKTKPGDSTLINRIKTIERNN